MLSDIERSLWHSLAVTISFAEMPMDERVKALHWLSDSAATGEREEKTAAIAREMEEVLLDIIKAARKHEFPTEATRHMVQRQLVPLMEGPLLQHFNPTLRQLVGIMIDRKEQLRAKRTISGLFPDGTSFELEIEEEEAIQAAIATLRLAEGGDLSNVGMGPTWIQPRIEKQLPDGKLVGIPYRVDLILLVPEVDINTQRQLTEHLLKYFLVTDSSIASALYHFHRILKQNDDLQVRSDALTDLIEAYLVSPYFALSRDFTHGIQVLRNGPIEALDRICGIGDEFQTPSPPDSRKGGLAVLGFKTRAIFENVRAQIPAQYTSVQVSYLSTHVREGAENQINIFESLWDFCLALMLAVSPQDLGLPPDESALLRNWITGFLANQLGDHSGALTRQLQTETLPSDDRVMEYIRRHVHAIGLRLGVYIAASPNHINELQSKLRKDDVVGEWLIRGLVLADRLLLIAYNDRVFDPDKGPSDSSKPSMDEMKRGFDRTIKTLNIGIDVSTYPDILNPFLYGPDEYDHFLSGILALLYSSLGDAEEVAAPYWMNTEVKSALITLKDRPENGAEAQLREGRMQGKPNRLDMILDRTPQELATAILDKVKS